MRYFLSILLFLSSTITFPSYTSTGNYISYESGLLTPSGAENITFTFTGVTLENEIEDMIDQRKKLFNSKLSQTITLEDFYNLLIALEQLYVMNGYFLTRFIVPAQTIEQNGKIRVIVFPGKIETNDYSGLDKRSLRPIKKYFDTVIGVTGIDYAVMEKIITKSRELPGVSLETTIKAGRELGSSSLQLQSDHDLVDGYFSYDNGLSESAGKDQFTSYFSLNSPFGFGEKIYGSYVIDPENNVDVPIDNKDILKRTDYREAYLIGAKVPVLSTDLFVFGSVNESSSEPKGLDKKGEFKSFNLGLDYQLKNSRLVKNNLLLDLQWNREREQALNASSDTFNDEYHALDLQYKTTNLSFLNSWSLQGTSSLKLGTPHYIKKTSDIKTRSRVGSTLNFIKWTSDINLSRRILEDYNLRTRFKFQKLISDRGLIGSQQIGITGPGQISGYASGNMSGDQGYVLRSEIGRTFYPIRANDMEFNSRSLSIEPYIHLGVGATYYKRPAAGEYSRTEAASIGYGINLSIPLNTNNLQINFEVAEADKSTDGTSSSPVYLLSTTFIF